MLTQQLLALTQLLHRVSPRALLAEDEAECEAAAELLCGGLALLAPCMCSTPALLREPSLCAQCLAGVVFAA